MSFHAATRNRSTLLAVGLAGAVGATVVLGALATSHTSVVLGLVGVLVVLCAAYLVWTAPPHYTFTLAIMLTPFAGNWQQLGLPGPAAPDRLLFLGGLLTVLLRGPAISDRGPVRLEAAHWAMALATLYAVISALVSHTLFHNAPGLKLVETFGIFPFMVFAVAPVVFPTARERGVLLSGLVALGTYLSLTTIFEFTGPKALVFPPYIENFSYGIHGGRGRGPFVDAVANGFALYTSGLACIIAINTWTSRRWRVFAGVVALLCLVGCVLTIERSVWIATVGGTVVALAATRTTRRWLLPALAAGAVIVGVALVAIPEASSKVTKQAGNQNSIWDRENLANTAYSMIRARPVFGFGWQTYETEHLPYERQLPTIPLTASTVGLHNILLAYAVELGLVGAALWVIALLLGVGGALLARAPPDLQPWRLGLLALFVFFILQENSVPPTVFQNQMLWLWAGVVWTARYPPALSVTAP